MATTSDDGENAAAGAVVPSVDMLGELGSAEWLMVWLDMLDEEVWPTVLVIRQNGGFAAGNIDHLSDWRMPVPCNDNVRLYA